MAQTVSLGLDFGTESVRAILIDVNGKHLGLGTSQYAHGVIADQLPNHLAKLPDRFALQCPRDWIDSSVAATKKAVKDAGISVDSIVGIGVDFTSCTMLPTNRAGIPLCELDAFKDQPLAWAKLWKHHGAIEQTERMNSIAREREEPFLTRYGGTIGLEWFFPKLLETIERAPNVAEAAEVWLEAGDWFVWQLVGGPAKALTRSTCQAGYKALWSSRDGYPSHDFFHAVHPAMAEAVANRMPGMMRSPGERAGVLSTEMASRFGLRAGTPVSTAIIDAHSAVPGVAAAEPGVLVMVLGTSSCHMLNSTKDQFVAGVAGVVDGGILPGLFGYETGQAAVGDAFAWLRNLLGLDSFESLSIEAMQLSPGADGVRCLDWMNGCRTPLMDGRLRGAFTGLGLNHRPAHLYRALLEASGFGLRWIIETMRESGVPVERFIATGGLPHHNRAIVKIYADVLQVDIEIHPSKQGPAVGAAVLGMVAAGPETSGFSSIADAAGAMAGVPVGSKDMVCPNIDLREAYDAIYREYRNLASVFSREVLHG